jgi:hypothetical protein
MGCLEIFGGNQCLSIETQDIGIIGILVQALITELVGQQGLALPEMLQCLVKNSFGALGLADGTPQTVFIFAK